MALNRFTQWLWPGGAGRVATHELTTAALTSSSFPDFPSGFREPDTVKFYTASSGGRRARLRRVRSRRRSRGEARVDREYDMVIVPSDGGGCLSGSESDDSDWSIGWLEPQAPELQTDGDPENCFAVLVPCYRHGHVEQTGRAEGRFLGAGTLADGLQGVETREIMKSGAEAAIKILHRQGRGDMLHTIQNVGERDNGNDDQEEGAL